MRPLWPEHAKKFVKNLHLSPVLCNIKPKMPKNVILDSFDRALLEQVQANNQLPARTLAARVGLSESAVLRRLRALRESKVISADISVVHPSILGLPLTIHVLVSLEREGVILLDSFIKKLRQRSEVRQAWYVTGEVEFVLRLQLASMEAYEVFTNEVFHNDPNVRIFRTIVAMREVIGDNIAREQPRSVG